SPKRTSSTFFDSSGIPRQQGDQRPLHDRRRRGEHGFVAIALEKARRPARPVQPPRSAAGGEQALARRRGALLESGDGFTDRDSDSSLAQERVERATGLESSPGIIVLLSPQAPVRSQAGQAQVREVAAELGEIPGVEAVASAAGDGDGRFVSRDGRTTYLAATLSATADDGRTLDALDERFGDRDDITLGGALIADEQLGDQISEDLGMAETLAFPLLLLLSFLFFRGVRAAALPLLIGLTTVLGTFLLLRVVNEFNELSIFCLNLVIGLGLGLAIDYTLFLLTRYREEMERSGPGAKAVRDTMATAGRTVVFSAATVAIALATLIVFPLNFLQSMAIGGAGVAIVAAVSACVIAPACSRFGTSSSRPATGAARTTAGTGSLGV
ncbi:MAG: MMPL family transporter, partial [Solirubrobacterales bacterium]|nr:MMPL family transporter [Solirubrobacterales bacterium]